ncbi:MAG: S26 family signal peptidase [Pseudomonadota bacterium]
MTACLALVCGVTVLQILRPPKPLLLYNPSNSAPIGWYRLEPVDILKRGDRVAAFAPEGATKLADARGYVPSHVPLIKTVWAIPGETVCRFDGLVQVHGRPDLKTDMHDRMGRSMPEWKGCVTLKTNEVFLVSKDVQTSWDSRYFGPVSTGNILGRVRFLGPRSGDQGGARGHSEAAGLQGKIKEGRAPLGLTPCLHISFRGAPLETGGTPNVCKYGANAAQRGSTPHSQRPALSREP